MREFDDEQDNRIATILGTEEAEVDEKTLNTYLKYLKEKIEFPCRLTGIEDFSWEEFYVLGPGSKKAYEKLKKKNPSYTDTFELIDDYSVWFVNS
jgi:hypothetical protein